MQINKNKSITQEECDSYKRPKLDLLLTLHISSKIAGLATGMQAFLMKISNQRLIDVSVLFSGILLTFAFAPFAFFPLAILTPALLLFFLHDVSAKRAFWLGYLFGLGLYGVGVYWVFISIHSFGDLPNWLAGIITAGMIAILACFPALTCYLTNRYFPRTNRAKILLAFPAIWVFSEWIRSWILTGFAWLFIGYSQTNSPLRGYAPLLSVYAVSLAALISSACLVSAIIKYKEKKIRSSVYYLLSLLIIWIIGGLLTLIPWTQPIGKPIAVSLIQGNVPQTIKWDPEHVNVSLQRYQQLTESTWGKDKLIIWPESAVPLPLIDARDFLNALDIQAEKNDSHLILGVPIETPTHEGYYNALITLGKEKQVYLKRRLVPFGEYTPLQKFLSSSFNFMNIPMSNLVAGNYFQQPFFLNNTKIQASICYEITFPEMIKTSDKELGLLLTVTNDAWFGESSAQAQHLQMAAMRAIELGRPVLFASNDGITAIINPNGTIAKAAPQRTTYVLNGMVQPMYGLTPWMRNGLDPMLAILIVSIIAAVRLNKKNDDN